MYHILSLAKILIWLTICISLYFTIDPYADPLVALGGGMVGIFLLGRWASFYLFYGWKRFVYHDQEQQKLVVESYKLSLLFGIYCLINVIFLLRHQWTILGGIILLIGFAIVQAILVPEK